MGIAINNFASSTEDRASGAQVIDGSLRFDQSKSNYLSFTPTTTGNRRTWTFSCWFKKMEDSASRVIFSSYGSAPWTAIQIEGTGSSYPGQMQVTFDAGSAPGYYTAAKYRDTGWYHLVWAVDTTQSTDPDKSKVYINGVLQTYSVNGHPSLDEQTPFNLASRTMYIGYTPNQMFDGHMSQVYLIDGQALTPSYFGFTDPLTNTWRPKKYTGTYGTNGFYLPMDGNSLIGEDKSGNGNDWTPVGFGGSNTIEKATGAFPILNTVNGGNVAVPGVFGSKVSKTLTTTASTNTSNGFVFENEGTKPTLSFVRGATYTFDYSASTAHPLRFATAADAVGSTEYTDGTDTSVANTVKITVPHNAPDTLYYYCTNHGGMGNSISVTTDEKVADPYAWKNVLALPLVGSANDVSNQINSGSSTKTATVSGSVASSAASNFYGGSYYFDGSNDNISYAHSDDFHIGASDFTIEGWVWKANKGSRSTWIGQRDGSTTEWRILFDYTVPDADSEGTVRLEWGSQALLFAVGVLKHSRWNHIALVRSGTTGTLYINGINVGTQTLNNIGDYAANIYLGQISSSGGEQYLGYMSDIRIYKGVAKYTSNFIPASTNPDILPDTPSGVAGGSALTKVTDGAVAFDGTGDYLSIADNADFTLGTNDFTMEGYFYATAYNNYARPFGQSTEGGGSTNNAIGFFFDTGGNGDTLYLRYGTNPSGTAAGATISNFNGGKNKWFHLALVRDGANLKIFKDGILLHTENIGASYSIYDSSANFNIGASSNPGEYWTGFISNVRVVNGTALYTSNFTPPTEPLTNVTNTKLLCCQSNTSATAAAVAPGSITANGNAAATNFNPFTTDINTVRGQESGYATLNPLAPSGGTFSNGNLDWASPATDQRIALSSISISTSGKWYCEFTIGSKTGAYWSVGIFGNPATWSPRRHYRSDGAVFDDGSQIATFSSFTQGDVIGITFDASTSVANYYKNGIFVGTTTSSPSASSQLYYFGCTSDSSGGSMNYSANFGQKPFKYNPPEGFKPLCLANLPRPSKAAVRPDKYFKTVLYTGDGNAGRSITGVGFQPDLLWIKQRTGAENHRLVDSVRGVGSGTGETKMLNPNTTDAEGSNTQIASLDLDGWTFNSTDTGVNGSGQSYVAWCWKAGDATVSNSDGSITSQVSANRDAGFSIVSWTASGTNNDTVGHGLGVVPDFMILKSRDGARDWLAYTQKIDGSLDFLRLNTTAAKADSSANVPTSTTFSVYGADVNTSGEDMIAYCFAEVEGYSKFGSYTGNGNADGPFVFLGFRPAWLMIRSTSISGNWAFVDSTRSYANVANHTLAANLANPESYYGNGESVFGALNKIDLLSNGFKPRENAGWANSSGATYIFAAFAEAPTNNLFGGQANAR